MFEETEIIIHQQDMRLLYIEVCQQCAGRGKQMWGSVLRKGKDLVKREESLAFFNAGSCSGLNRQKLPLHRKFRTGTLRVA